MARFTDEMIGAVVQKAKYSDPRATQELSASVVSLRQRHCRLLDSGEYAGVEVTALHLQRPGWARPAAFFFRRGGSGWALVGVERG